jgi:hypothetical protein
MSCQWAVAKPKGDMGCSYLEVLVACGRANRAAVWAEGARQDACVVCGHLPDLLERRVGPEADIVAREAVGREDLLRVGGKDERRYL